ncbi:MAG: hypothetical protein LBD74_03895 [Spirochaetaceae bacterium]|jgi:hypothetical protein|nr:hypothetical protein [Spirochaetaceae bacterium]
MEKSFMVMHGIVALLCATCTGNPPEQPVVWTAPKEERLIRLYQIIDFKDNHRGGDIPEWVHRYERQGISGVEGLAEYANDYIFISELEGTSFKALQQWSSGFVPAKDLSRLVASRIQERVTQRVSTYPEGEYGRFFEAFIRAASDAVYSGAVQVGDFWVLKEYFQEDGVTPDREVYNFLILIRIDKTVLRKSIQEILASLGPMSLTKAQTQAVNRLKETFFDFF